VRISVTEDDVVVEKRPVAKEEVRVRKDMVEDTEVDVVEDATTERRLER
jgi:stress response protein YsnF